jgi:putative ABC transport system permease protein
MLKNYLITILRSFRRTPVYSVLNLAGLALGIACATLIFLWVVNELKYDRSYPKHNEIYTIRMNIDYSGKIESYTSIPGPMPAAIRGAVPGVVNVCRFGFSRDAFALNDKSTFENGLNVDTSFFSMFQQSFVKGNAAGFIHPHTLVLTEKMARKFFATADPVGKTLRVDNQQDYTVIGVVKDPLPDVSIQFEWLAPVDNFVEKNQWLNNWGTYGISTDVELQPGTDINRVSQQLTAILRPKHRIYAGASCVLQSMNDWHLYNNYINGKPDGGQMRYVKLMSAIGWIILVIACINFMNLATARAGQRAREIGVRKTLGAIRKALIGQFLVEALVMAFLALLLAVGLVYLSLPAFNTLVQRHLSFDLFTPANLIGLLVIGTFSGLIAGSYPAFYLSSFHPVAVLKGQRIGLNTGAGFIRKGLVVAQFAVSVTLIICTVIIYEQIQHIKDRDLGYTKEHLLSTGLQGNLVEHFAAFRSDLLRTGVVADAALSGSPLLSMWGHTNSNIMTWEGSDPENKIMIYDEGVSPEYLSTMGLTLKEGRNFDQDIKADSGHVIINESLAKVMGKAGRVGEYLTYNGRLRLQIVGIAKDFLFNDMYGSVSPLVLTCDPETRENYGFLDIRLKSGNDLSSTLAKVEAVMKADNPGYPFSYSFADEQFNNQFQGETLIGKLAGIFSVLAIFISCLGLFGLAAYTAERRTKEIGIRKVLGASSTGLAALLSKEFLQWVAIACLIAFPLAWWAMSRWLDDYAYRTAIHWWVFAVTGIAALFIALLTVSIQAVRAALSNPVQTLRSE